MSTAIWIILAAVVVVVVIGAVLAGQSRRRQRLRSTFGPEYDRAVQGGNRRDAEAELAGRVKRREGYQIRSLEPAVRGQYMASWQAVQARFVDDPSGSVRDADGLVNEVMSRRGYPMADFEQRAADVSVDHAGVVEDYRSAHGVADRIDGGEVSTEDLREAMVHYRALFSSLLAANEPVQQQQEQQVRS
jgi:hypothetical protein